MVGKRHAWIVLAPLLAGLGGAFAAPPGAGGSPLPPGATAYLHDSSTSYDQSKWMAGLSGETPLSRISMVGTHESCSYVGGDIAQCQSLSLKDQLKMGVRARDLRLREVENGFEVYHGILDQDVNGLSAMGDIFAFLKENPSETVIVRIDDSGQAINSTKTWEEAYRDVIFNHFKSIRKDIFWEKPDLPLLKDVRGRIVVLVNFDPTSKTCYGCNYHGMSVKEDHFVVENNWGLYEKWGYVKAFLDQTLAAAPADRLAFNYLSAGRGAFPYFVASGKSDPRTGANQLLTGFTTLTSKDKYPDFPRVGCLAGLCSIAFLGTNQLASDYLAKRMIGIQGTAKGARGPASVPTVGILMADFPGPQLVDTVISLNRFEADDMPVTRPRRGRSPD